MHKRTSSSVKSYQIGKSPKKIYKVSDPYDRINKESSNGRKSLYSKPKEGEDNENKNNFGYNKNNQIERKTEGVSNGKYGGNLIRNMEGNSDIGDGKSHQVFGEHDSENGSMNDLFESVMSQSGHAGFSKDHSSFISTLSFSCIFQ